MDLGVNIFYHLSCHCFCSVASCKTLPHKESYVQCIWQTDICTLSSNCKWGGNSKNVCNRDVGCQRGMTGNKGEGELKK